MVTRVIECRYGDGSLAALQLVFAGGRSVVLTVWIDWVLVVDSRGDDALPDYLWPPETIGVRDLISGLPPEGAPIESVHESRSEYDDLVELEFILHGHRIKAGMWAGDLTLDVQDREV
ncbi:hypothetical protein [Actinokineospora diospyrosa]|nr:hypothetical protein [Actinokineospora diospyrosa]